MVYVSDLAKPYGKEISKDNIDALKIYYPEDFIGYTKLSKEQTLHEIYKQ